MENEEFDRDLSRIIGTVFAREEKRDVDRQYTSYINFIEDLIQSLVEYIELLIIGIE